MAGLKLDDLFDNSKLTKRKKLLDLAKVKIEDYDDYVKYMDKAPEIKMVPDQVNMEELASSLGDFSFYPSKKERLELLEVVNRIPPDYEDPMPLSMRDVRLDDLYSVDIHWKMLTDLRPVSRKEEEYFNRIIDLGKFMRNTRAQEANAITAMMSSVPGSSVQAKAIAMGFITYKSKRGTMETKLKSCRECGLELCTGAWCKVQHYECYTRVILDKDELEAEEKGFSLKSVIAQATAKPDAKAAEKKAKERRDAKKGPSLKAMITRRKPRKRKKKKQSKIDEEPVKQPD